MKQNGLVSIVVILIFSFGLLVQGCGSGGNNDDSDRDMQPESGSAFNFGNAVFQNQFGTLGLTVEDLTPGTGGDNQGFLRRLGRQTQILQAQVGIQDWNAHLVNTTPSWLSGGQDFSGANKRAERAITEADRILFTDFKFNSDIELQSAGLPTRNLQQADDGREFSEALQLHFRRLLFPDGSQRVEYFTDANLTENAGFVAMDAPRWSGVSGTYPVLVRYAVDLTVGGFHRQGAVGLVVENPNVTSGTLAMVFLDDQGTAMFYKLQFAPGDSREYVRLEQGDTWIETTTVSALEADILFHFVLEASSGEEGTLAIFTDLSGVVTVEDSGKTIFKLVWEADQSGFAELPDGNTMFFDDVSVFLEL